MIWWSSEQVHQHSHLWLACAFLEDALAIAQSSLRVHRIFLEHSMEHVGRKHIRAGTTLATVHWFKVCCPDSLEVAIVARVVIAHQMSELSLPMAPVRIFGTANTQNLLLHGVVQMRKVHVF